jgi:hypothetical protein
VRSERERAKRAEIFHRLYVVDGERGVKGNLLQRVHFCCVWVVCGLGVGTLCYRLQGGPTAIPSYPGFPTLG